MPAPSKWKAGYFMALKVSVSFRNGTGVPVMIQIIFFWRALLTQPSVSPFGVEEVKFLAPRSVLVCLVLRDSKVVH